MFGMWEAKSHCVPIGATILKPQTALPGWLTAQIRLDLTTVKQSYTHFSKKKYTVGNEFIHSNPF